MKKTIKDSLRHLPCIVATLFLLAAAACMPESFKPGIDTPGSRDRSPMTLELGISSPESSIRTRADESGPMGDSTINSIWIGVFDIETGDLVGQTASNRTQGETEKYPFRTAKVDILYYDAHPQVRIFGVANYIGVNARRTGTDYPSCNTPLGTLLNDVENITDFLDISVEAKEPGNSAPLMMGVYTNSDVSGRYAVDITDSQQLHNFDKETDIALNELHDPKNKTGKYNRIDYAYMNGQIRLRRLVSQINVTVVPGQSSDKTVELSNMSYRRVNLPKEVYLQERQTKGFESSWNATEWGKQTPNKADVLVDYVTGNSALGYESDTDFKAFNNSFTFYQYENKHWGTADNQSEREKVWKGTDSAENPVFTALCGEEENGKIYNNYASYFEINVDVAVTEKGSTRNANVTYRIHEGYCNDINGKEEPVPSENAPESEWATYYEKVAEDFTCVRNTLYNYTITINGLTSITVTEGEHTHTNPGVLGGAEFFTESTEEATKPITIDPNSNPNESYSFNNVEAAAYICYYENGGKPQYYAGGDDDGIAKLKDLSILPAGFNAATKVEPNNFGFKFDDSGTIQSISDIFSPATRADSEMETKLINGTIVPDFNGLSNVNPEDYKMSLYLLLSSKVLEDDCINNTYTYIHALPLDSRQEMGEFDFSLAFANDWDEDPAESNGAVVGHLKKIQVTDLEWKSTAGLPDDLKYTVFLDDELIADEITSPLELEEEFNTYTANSVHTIKVVAEDPDNTYKPCTISQNFIVYPSEFEWSYRTYNSDYFEATDGSSSSSSSSGSYYGSADYQRYHADETGLNNYYALHQEADNMTNYPTYLQTDGNRTIFHIDPLYDAVLTIYASNNSSSAQLEKCISVSYSESGEQVQTQQSSVGFAATNDGTPFTFYLDKDKGPVNIVSSSTSTDPKIGGNIRIYAVKLEYYNPQNKRSWKFSESTKWDPLLNSLQVKDDKGSVIDKELSSFTSTIDGLNITVNGKVRTYDSKYSGNPKSAIYSSNSKSVSFAFQVHKSGTLTISAAGGSATARYFQVEIDGTPLFTNDFTKENYPSVESTQTAKEIEIPIKLQSEGKCTTIKLYTASGGGTYYYGISYE